MQLQAVITFEATVWRKKSGFHRIILASPLSGLATVANQSPRAAGVSPKAVDIGSEADYHCLFRPVFWGVEPCT